MRTSSDLASASTWINSAGGSFQTAGNWNGGVPNNSTTEALFNLSAIDPYTVTFAADASSQKLMGGNDNVILDLSSHTYTVVGNGNPDPMFQSAGALGTSSGQTSNFTITNGTLKVASYLSMAAAAGSSSRVTVTGNGSVFSLDRNLYVGDFGSGRLDVVDGGKVVAKSSIDVASNRGASGTVNINGPTSILDQTPIGGMTISPSGNSSGSLNITAGGRLINNGLKLGWGYSSNDTATISGVSGSQRSTLTAGVVTVGNSGVATLQVSDGALVTGVAMSAGNSSPSVGTITLGGASGGRNAEINLTRFMTLGSNQGGYGVNQSYSGALIVNTGGKFTTDEFTLGNGDAPGTTNIVGTGHITVNGGDVRGRLLRLRSGSVTISGGSLTTSDETTDHTAVTFNQTGGTHTVFVRTSVNNLGSILIDDAYRSPGIPSSYNLSGGGLNANLINNGRFNYSGGNYTGDITNNAIGEINVSGPGVRTIAGSLTNNGMLRTSGADLIVTGNYTSTTTSKMAMQISYDSDQFDIGGPAVFRGSIQLIRDPAVSPALYTPITLSTFESSSGRFGSINGVELSDTYRFALSYLPTRITLTPALIGDLNLDHSVSIADFISLASHMGQTGASWSEGDLNGDGSVTIVDFIDLAGHFNTTYSGQTIPISAADEHLLTAFANSMPEPASLLLCGVGVGLLFFYRRRSSCTTFLHSSPIFPARE